MPVQYVIGTRVNTTAVCANKTDVLNFLEAQLPLAGWSVVSGSGTTNRLFQSGTTTQGLALRMRAKDNGGTCVNISIESTDGTLASTNSTTAGGSINPTGAPTIRLIANAFQFFLYSPANYANNRLFVMVCCPFIPSPVAVPARAGFMLSDSTADANATQRESWRTVLPSGTAANGPGNCAHIWGASLWQINNGFIGNWQGIAALVIMQTFTGGGTGSGGNPNLRRWANGDDITSDTLIQYAATVVTDEPQIRAQMWDSIVIHNSFAGDTPATFDGHDWLGITNLNAGLSLPTLTNNAVSPRGTLFIAVT